METALVASYWATFFFYALACCFNIIRQQVLEDLSAWAGLIVNIASLILIVAWSGQAPAFDLFESMIFAACMLAGIGILCSKQEEHLPDVRSWVWLEVLLLLGVSVFLEKKPSLYLYDHNYTYILLFHLMRFSVIFLNLFFSALYI